MPTPAGWVRGQPHRAVHANLKAGRQLDDRQTPTSQWLASYSVHSLCASLAVQCQCALVPSVLRPAPKVRVSAGEDLVCSAAWGAALLLETRFTHAPLSTRPDVSRCGPSHLNDLSHLTTIDMLIHTLPTLSYSYHFPLRSPPSGCSPWRAARHPPTWRLPYAPRSSYGTTCTTRPAGSCGEATARGPAPYQVGAQRQGCREVKPSNV